MSLVSTGHFDADIYSGSDRFAGYVTSIAPNEEEDEEEEMGGAHGRASYSAPTDLLNDLPPNDQVREGVFSLVVSEEGDIPIGTHCLTV